MVKLNRRQHLNSQINLNIIKQNNQTFMGLQPKQYVGKKSNLNLINFLDLITSS